MVWKDAACSLQLWEPRNSVVNCKRHFDFFIVQVLQFEEQLFDLCFRTGGTSLSIMSHLSVFLIMAAIPPSVCYKLHCWLLHFPLFQAACFCFVICERKATCNILVEQFLYLLFDSQTVKKDSSNMLLHWRATQFIFFNSYLFHDSVLALSMIFS